MIVFPEMLVDAATKAEMKVPEDTDDYQPQEYPHFHVFCAFQLGRPMSDWTQHWDNAKIIAQIPDNEIMQVSISDLIQKGCRI